MKIVDLTVLHNTEGTSDKIWGFFKDSDSGRWHRFWGKRTARSYQILETTLFELREDQIKKVKKGYKAKSLHVLNHVRGVLEIQFGIPISPLSTVIREKSAVTGQEMEAPIRPSEVARTEERLEDSQLFLFFYDEYSKVLGKRPLSEKEAIFNHLRKTKEEVNADKMTGIDSEGHVYTYINWEEKTPA